MIITTKTGTIKKEKFDEILYDKDGSIIDDFVINTVDDETGVTLDGYSVTIAEGTSFVPGDSVIMIEEDGLERKNVVEQSGVNILKLQERLNSFAPSKSVTIKPDFISITFDLTDNEMYRFSDNEILIISPSFFNLFVNFASVSNRYKNLKSNANIELMNSEAKESIFADFSFDTLFFRKLDMGQLRELLILKVCALAELRNDPMENIRHQDNYEQYKATVVNILSMNEDGVIDPDALEEGLEATNSFPWGWGE